MVIIAFKSHFTTTSNWDETVTLYILNPLLQPALVWTIWASRSMPLDLSPSDQLSSLFLLYPLWNIPFIVSLPYLYITSHPSVHYQHIYMRFFSSLDISIPRKAIPFQLFYWCPFQTASYTYTFRIFSIFITPHIHLNIFVSSACNFFSSLY